MIQKKIVILGGQGFVGLNISKYFLSKKINYKLILIGNKTKLKKMKELHWVYTIRSLSILT